MKKILIVVVPVLLITTFSCKKQDTVKHDTVYDTIKVNSNIEYQLLENTVLTLDATNLEASAYVWTPGNYTTPSINVTTDGIYTVKVTIHGSTYVYEVVVYYQGSDCYIPDSFTPNGDGLNDIWDPSFINIKDEDFLLNIYDAQNKKLFSSTNQHDGWDGKYNGNLMPAGYYYYTISYKTVIGEPKSRNGMLQLVL
jgi:gliding motility-associated-like protein